MPNYYDAVERKGDLLLRHETKRRWQGLKCSAHAELAVRHLREVRAPSRSEVSEVPAI